MILWRVSAFADLAGTGGLHVGGRWHTQGRPIVYASESVALALLEVLAQIEDKLELPPDYQLLEIAAPDDLDHDEWADVLPSLAESRAWGDRWLDTGATALCRVPAAVAPHSWNWLLNPRHPGASTVALASTADWPWDHRLTS